MRHITIYECFDTLQITKNPTENTITVEEADAFLFFLAHFTASFPSSWQGFPAPLSLQDSQVL